MTFCVGLTGGIASGKSTVANCLATRGIEIIDTDQISRDLVQPDAPAWHAIVEHFGEKILLPNQQLDRTQLRQIVFDQPEERFWLESLLHPLIRATAIDHIGHSTSPYCAVVIPLLNKQRLQEYPIDRVLCVTAPAELQIKRLMERDAIPYETAKTMIAAQPTEEERIAIAHDLLQNTGTREALTTNTLALHKQYRAYANSQP